MLQSQGFTVQDFTGGKTDYIYTAPPNKAEFLTNLVLNRNGQIELRLGLTIYDTAAYQIPDGAVRVQTLIPTYNEDFLYIQSSRKIWRIDSGAFTEILGPSSNPALPSGTTANFLSFSEWNKHIYVTSDALGKPMRIFPNASNVPVVRNAGLPALATTPVVTSTGGTGNSYIYTFLYFYTYQINTVVFEDFGATTIVEVSNIGAPNTNTVNITAIPVISNGATDNYDTTTIKVKIYRTTNGGTTGFFVGEVTNGTTTYNDTSSDATIQNNVGLYTNGGVVDNDSPPPSRYVHVVNGKAYYGYIKDGTEEIPNRVIQSLTDDPDSVPATFFVDLEDEVTGISSFNGKPIVFGKSKTYRLDGEFNELGQGFIQYEAISTVTGCLSNLSVVRTRDGVFWAGNDGFYWTDGFTCKKVSDSLNESYKLLTDTTTKDKRIYGSYDPIENRIYWTVQIDASSPDNDGMYVLDLRQGVKSESCFTTFDFDGNISPTSLAFYQGELVQGDRRGYVFKHDVDSAEDAKINTALAPTLWASKTIIYNYTSVLLDMGTTAITKWGQWLIFKAKNIKNLSMQPFSINDSTFIEDELKEIRIRTAAEWGDPSVFAWGDVTAIPWGFDGNIEERRRFPAGSLRFRAKQMKFTNSFTNIYRSDNLGLGAVDATAKTVTLPVNTWPTEILDYYVTFADDNYTVNYLITSIVGTVITYEDVQGNSVTNPSEAWLVRGFRKDEKFFPISYTIYSAQIGNRSQPTYQGTVSDTGDNSA